MSQGSAPSETSITIKKLNLDESEELVRVFPRFFSRDWKILGSSIEATNSISTNDAKNNDNDYRGGRRAHGGQPGWAHQIFRTHCHSDCYSGKKYNNLILSANLVSFFFNISHIKKLNLRKNLILSGTFSTNYTMKRCSDSGNGWRNSFGEAERQHACGVGRGRLLDWWVHAHASSSARS